MGARARTQRRIFDRQLERLRVDGRPDERDAVNSLTAENIDDLYQLSLDKYISVRGQRSVVAYDGESQTPILDKLLDFFKWLWESGALMELIKLLIGGGFAVLLEQPEE